MILSVSKAKEHCGYKAKPVFNTCANCGSFKSEMKLPEWMAERGKDWDGTQFTVENDGVEKNMRCTDDGFSTKKTATCNLWREKS